MTSTMTRRTNGDLVQPAVDRVRSGALAALEYVKAHPDELAVGVAPLLMLTLATRRHKLNLAEAALIGEVAFWSGVFAAESYRNWKTRPAGTVPRLRKVQ